MSMIGKTLGTFECTAQLGKGGMGEVYRAKDQKLGRDVAIKVLPQEFAQDTDRVARFQREAKLLASLNHPNIAAIHGLEESDGTHFLVLELIEGDTLADRLKQGAVPIEESLKLALQITEALEAAHEKGVIHRDLKPANIKVTPEGKIKVLDFGLAKAFAGDKSDLNLSNSPTLSEAATMQGVILGTAAYMPPEQAKGKSVDKRADIWAFGVVLFEMLSGGRLFTGETVSETLASVIKSEPEWKSLPPNLHPRIRLLLERCLEKEPKNRYGVISDARVDIERALVDPIGALVQPTTAIDRRSGMRKMSPYVAVVVLVGMIVGLSVWFLRAPEPHKISRLYYQLPEDQSFTAPDSQRGLAISPDGQQFVYLTNKGLFLRYLEKWDASLLIDPEEGPQQPLFSPDGKWVGYWSNRDKQLKKIAISGGAPVPVCNMLYSNGAYWSEDNKIVYSEFQKGIAQVSADGGTPERIIEPEGNDFWFPQILPSGKSILFTQGSTIVVQSLESEDRKKLFTGYGAQYIKTGHIIYGLENNLYAIPFDPKKLEVTGDPTILVEDLLLLNSGPQYAVSDSGTLVYVTGSISYQAQLEWYDRQGNQIGSVGEPAAYRQFSLSPNEKQVVIERRSSGGSDDLWVLELDRNGLDSRITSDDYDENDPIWSPDGDYIAFRSNRTTPDSLYRKTPIAEGKVELIKESQEQTLIPEDWSKNFIAYLEMSDKGQSIFLLPLSDGQDSELFAEGNYNYDEPKLSPDDKWLAYVSNEGVGINEVYIRQLEGDGFWRISTKGGMHPQWREDGKEIFYLDLNGSMMAVELKGETKEPTQPEELFKTGTIFDPRYDSYAVMSDGEKFLILKPLNSGNVLSLNIVSNWFEELKQRVPIP